MNRPTRLAALLLTPLLMGGVAFTTIPAFAQSPGRVAATADIKDAGGQTIGEATFRTTEAGEVRVQVKVRDFAATEGEHGIHIHAIGSCVAPGFTSAGPHFNPHTRQHGFLNPVGYHAGDMPNMVFNSNGNATYNFTTADVSLERGVPNSLFDADGSAIVIHAGRDDLTSDPSGNSGPRVACGAIEEVEQSGPGEGQPSPLNPFAWLALLSVAPITAGLAADRIRKATK